MADVTLALDHDELLGLGALAALDAAGDGAGTGTGPAAAARALLDTALAGRLAQAGLPWAPPAGEAAGREAAGPAAPGGAALRRDLPAGLALAAVVLLWGGYARGWAWTGFRANGQLWDWLSLLLLPVTIAVIPLWIQYRAYISRARRAAYWAVIAGWAGFVAAGYLVPLGWTGFRGVTLWMWLSLLAVPVALAVTMAMASMRVRPAAALRALRPYQRAALAALGAGWALTLAGGYALGWKWTGYTDPGNGTLWAWLQMLLVPLLLPTLAQPALLRWITGGAQDRAAAAPHGQQHGQQPAAVPGGAALSR